MIQGNKNDFPLLKDNDLVYLDSSATAQRPFTVLEAEADFYKYHNANPLRGFYDLAMEATDEYEKARETVRGFIGAASTEEIIFTRNTSESINLVAYSYGCHFLKPGDEILVTIMEHHSNLLPWQMVARQTGAVLKFLECDENGSFPDERIRSMITSKTKLAAINHVSNVLGTLNPVEKIIRLVHEQGGVVLVDGAQSTPHMPVNVQILDADFFAFSGHKLMGPMGIGVLYGKKDLLNAMPPFLSGGEMIEYVTRESATFAPLPHKFEAGTVNGAGACALAAAIEYIKAIGFSTICKREDELTKLCFEGMKKIPGVRILGSENPGNHHGILSFVVDGVHPHDISAILNDDNIAIRAGHHCAQPLLKHLGVPSSARASIAFYNTEEDINRFLTSLGSIRRKMGLE